MSISIFAGIAIRPSSLDSTISFELIVVSKSEAETLSTVPLISNKKLSKIGRVLLEFKTPCMRESCLSSEALDTIKFISVLIEFCKYKNKPQFQPY